MIPGYNHNIRYKDRVFHVQTEDSGTANPHIITHLFVGGNIIESRKTSYAEHVGSDRLTDVVVELMQAQHKGMLRDLIGGKCDDKIATRSVNAATLNGPAPLNVDAGAQHRSSLMVGQSSDPPRPQPSAATATAATMNAPAPQAPRPATPSHLITRMPTVAAPAPVHAPAQAAAAAAQMSTTAGAPSLAAQRATAPPGPSPILPAAPAPRPATPTPAAAAPLPAAATTPTRFPVATPTPSPALTAFAPRAPVLAAPPGAPPPAVATSPRPVHTSPPPPARPATPGPAASTPAPSVAAVAAAKANETVINADTLARAFGAPSDSAVDSIFGEDLISEKSLDEVILSYLADDAKLG